MRWYARLFSCVCVSLYMSAISSHAFQWDLHLHFSTYIYRLLLQHFIPEKRARTQQALAILLLIAMFGQLQFMQSATCRLGDRSLSLAGFICETVICGLVACARAHHRNEFQAHSFIRSCLSFEAVVIFLVCCLLSVWPSVCGSTDRHRWGRRRDRSPMLWHCGSGSTSRTLHSTHTALI